MALLGFMGYAPVLPTKLGSSFNYDHKFHSMYNVYIAQTQSYLSLTQEKLGAGSTENFVKGRFPYDLKLLYQYYNCHTNTCTVTAEMQLRNSVDNAIFTDVATVLSIPTITTGIYTDETEYSLEAGEYHHFRIFAGGSGGASVQGDIEVHIQ